MWSPSCQTLCWCAGWWGSSLGCFLGEGGGNRGHQWPDTRECCRFDWMDVVTILPNFVLVSWIVC